MIHMFVDGKKEACPHTERVTIICILKRLLLWINRFNMHVNIGRPIVCTLIFSRIKIQENCEMQTLVDHVTEDVLQLGLGVGLATGQDLTQGAVGREGAQHKVLVLSTLWKKTDFYNKGCRKKRYFFSGPVTKALPPPP